MEEEVVNENKKLNLASTELKMMEPFEKHHNIDMFWMILEIKEDIWINKKNRRTWNKNK